MAQTAHDGILHTRQIFLPKEVHGRKCSACRIWSVSSKICTIVLAGAKAQMYCQRQSYSMHVQWQK